MTDRIVQHAKTVRRGRRAGRRALYGERAIPLQAGVPPALVAAIKAEALRRNVAAGDPDLWSASRVAAEALIERFGKE